MKDKKNNQSTPVPYAFKIKRELLATHLFRCIFLFFPISFSFKKKKKLQPPFLRVYLMPTHPEYPSHTFIKKNHIFHIHKANNSLNPRGFFCLLSVSSLPFQIKSIFILRDVIVVCWDIGSILLSQKLKSASFLENKLIKI